MRKQTVVRGILLLCTLPGIPVAPVAFAALGFGGPALLNTTATTDTSGDQDAQVATDGLGHWVAIWQSNEDLNSAETDADIFVSRSSDNGVTWTAPAFVNTDAATDAAGDYTPQLVADGSGTWIAVWESNVDRNGAGGDLDIFFAQSLDNGETWSAPEALNTNAATDSGFDQNPHLATDGSTWIAVWDSFVDLSGAGTDADIFVSRSVNGGDTWTAPELLNTNATTDSGRDEDPRIATDSSGNWIAVWESDEDLAKTAGTDDDVFFAVSTNSGLSWSAPAALNGNADSDTAFDVDPWIAADTQGHWVAMWGTSENVGGAGADPDIFYSQSTNGGAMWSAMAPINDYATSDSGTDLSPRVVASASGEWAAIWLSTFNLSGAGNDRDVFVSRSSDGGITWGAPGVLNANATTDSKDDQNPHLATDGFGSWVAVWHSGEDFSGSGTDFDILVSTSTTLEDPALTIVTPNGGEKWKIGKKKKITWTSAKGLPQVKIELLRNGGVVKTIKNSTNDDGAQKWRIKGVVPGKGYKVRITAINGPENTDDSDGTFKIKAAK